MIEKNEKETSKEKSVSLNMTLKTQHVTKSCGRRIDLTQCRISDCITHKISINQLINVKKDVIFTARCGVQLDKCLRVFHIL